MRPRDIERRHLLVLKSIEHGLLEPVGDGPRAALEGPFRLNFRPNRFGPRPEDPVPPGPLMFNEAVVVAAPLLLPAAACGLIAIYVYPSTWSWLLSASAICLGGIAAAILAVGAINGRRDDRSVGAP